MKTCNKCGHSNNDKMLFCESCGTKLTGSYSQNNAYQGKPASSNNGYNQGQASYQQGGGYQNKSASTQNAYGQNANAYKQSNSYQGNRSAGGQNAFNQKQNSYQQGNSYQNKSAAPNQRSNSYQQSNAYQKNSAPGNQNTAGQKPNSYAQSNAYLGKPSPSGQGAFNQKPNSYQQGSQSQGGQSSFNQKPNDHMQSNSYAKTNDGFNSNANQGHSTSQKSFEQQKSSFGQNNSYTPDNTKSQSMSQNTFGANSSGIGDNSSFQEKPSASQEELPSNTATTDFGSKYQTSSAPKQTNDYSAASQYTPSSTQPKGMIRLGDGEIRIKTYHFASLKRPMADGYLTITNKRVIMHSKGSASEAFEDAHINAINGTNTSYGYTRNMIKLLIGIWFALSSVGSFIGAIASAGSSSNSYNSYSSFGGGGLGSAGAIGLTVWGIIMLIIGVILILGSRNTFFYLSILSSASNASINLACESGRSRRLTVAASAFLAKSAVPTKITPMMSKEIGAIIMDVKTLGDNAIKKWSPSHNSNISVIKDEVEYTKKYFD